MSGCGFSMTLGLLEEWLDMTAFHPFCGENKEVLGLVITSSEAGAFTADVVTFLECCKAVLDVLMQPLLAVEVLNEIILEIEVIHVGQWKSAVNAVAHVCEKMVENNPDSEMEDRTEQEA